MAELSVGYTIAGCRLEALAGRGGMGVVWRAAQVALDRPVAIKVIAPRLAQDIAFRERFQRESQLAASIDHPNVIPVYEAGELEGILYLIMRWVDGTDLRARLIAEGGLEPRDAIRLLRPVASALAAAHRRGLIHRDVKPANVLIASAEHGQDEHVYLTDFGIARRSETRGMTRTGVLVGTVDYMSPERIEGGKGTPASDIYAFGCMLFETLTGHVPFERPAELAKMFAHINDPVPSEQVTQPLSAIVERAMAKRPEDRFASAGELVAALDRAAGHATGPTGRSVAPEVPAADATVASEWVDPADARVASERVDPADATVMAGTSAAQPAAGEETVMAPGTTEPLAEATVMAQPSSPPAQTPIHETPIHEPSGTPPPPPPPAPPSRSRAKPLAIAAGLAIGAGIAAVVTLGGGGNRTSSPGAATGGPSAPRSKAELVSGGAVHVGSPRALPGEPLAIAAAGPDAWAATPGHLIELAASAGTPVIDQISSPGAPSGAAVDSRGRVWLAGVGGEGVQQTTPKLVAAGRTSRALALSSGAAVIATADSGTVTRVDFTALGSPQSIPVTGPVSALGAAYGRTWIASPGGAVTVLDADGRRDPLSAPSVAPRSVGVAQSNGVWFLSSSGVLSRIDPRTTVSVGGRYRQPPVRIRAGGDAAGIGATEGTAAIWVLSRADRTLTRIGTTGATDQRVTARIVFSATPGHLAVGDHVLWVDVPSTHEIYPISF